MVCSLESCNRGLVDKQEQQRLPPEGSATQDIARINARVQRQTQVQGASKGGENEGVEGRGGESSHFSCRHIYIYIFCIIIFQINKNNIPKIWLLSLLRLLRRETKKDNEF
jgi:hypothetical protein